MGTLGNDAVDRAFSLILSDDRRRLTAEEETEAKRHWRHVFRAVKDTDLLKAVSTWLSDNPKGRPNVGKIRELLPKQSTSQLGNQRVSEEWFEWALRVLEAKETSLEWGGRISEPPYRHTLDAAEQELRRRGFSSWREAKGITTTTTEAIL